MVEGDNPVGAHRVSGGPEGLHGCASSETSSGLPMSALTMGPVLNICQYFIKFDKSCHPCAVWFPL